MAAMYCRHVSKMVRQGICEMTALDGETEERDNLEEGRKVAVWVWVLIGIIVIWAVFLRKKK